MNEHNCYGGYIANVFQFTAKGEGAAREEMREFNCMLPPPAIGNLMTYRVSSWSHLLVVFFFNLWDCKGKEIYYGSYKERRERNTFEDSCYCVEYAHKELVTRCKMSNGMEVGDLGYALVSLATVFMFVGVQENFQHRVRATPHLTHLLTNFVIPILEPGIGGGSSS
ncbi:unnamed protein product [Arabis nemorensis]|uniref:Uncharacterized protein n=1 Tax=Arabis nemorensis TaxID=586526 RepID=A0A565CAF4_9BRAS|nr:unnamed protein product [Arabis nemorensis]